MPMDPEYAIMMIAYDQERENRTVLVECDFCAEVFEEDDTVHWWNRYCGSHTACADCYNEHLRECRTCWMQRQDEEYADLAYD